MTDDLLREFILLARSVQHRYELDKMEAARLRVLMSALDQARDEVESRLARLYVAGGQEWSKSRAEAVLDELEALATGVYAQIEGSIAEIAIEAGAMSVEAHNSIMSFDGRVAGFDNVALSAAQLRAAVVETPVGGRLLSQWLAGAYEMAIVDGVRRETLSGLLQGEGFPALVRRLTDAFDITKREAEVISRTYVQQINNDAHAAVMQANADIVKGWKWSAATENGNFRTGHGICLRCLALDSAEEVYPIDGGPAIPLHPACRCVRRIVTKSWRELGIDLDELKDSETFRPYTVRGYIDAETGELRTRPVGTGGRQIISVGQFMGSYEDWLKVQPVQIQRMTLGPRRWELWNEGKIDLSDLADASGNQKTLKELAQ